jgi:hypothetical protein
VVGLSVLHRLVGLVRLRRVERGGDVEVEVVLPDGQAVLPIPHAGGSC